MRTVLTTREMRLIHRAWTAWKKNHPNATTEDVTHWLTQTASEYNTESHVVQGITERRAYILSQQEVAEICTLSRRLGSMRGKYAAIARQYGVTRSAVHRIVSKERHAPDDA